jgi:hypothetical protein
MSFVIQLLNAYRELPVRISHTLTREGKGVMLESSKKGRKSRSFPRIIRLIWLEKGPLRQPFFFKELKCSSIGVAEGEYDENEAIVQVTNISSGALDQTVRALLNR